MVISVPEGYAARFAALVALLVKLPRTVKEIQTALGYGDRRSVEMLIHHLRGEGLVYLKEWRQAHRYAKLQPVYAWQPSVCEMPDTPQPAVARRGASRHNRGSTHLTRSPIHETDSFLDA